VPDVKNLRFQAVHTDDVAEAYRLAAVGDARGPFNIAADPILGPPELADLFSARRLNLPPRLLRAITDVSWRLRLQPTPAGWIDMGLQTPLLDSTRARSELGWQPRHSSKHALVELLDGLREGTGFDTPPLSPETSGPLRSGEFGTGIGKS
jgi:nucleoside-diphosphate-sugar epimerase